MRLLVYQGARQWSPEEVYVRLGLGDDVTLDEVGARLTSLRLQTIPASGIVHDARGQAIVVRLPAAQPRTFTESQGLDLEARLATLQAELERTTADLGRERAAHDETRKQLRAERREGQWMDGRRRAS